MAAALNDPPEGWGAMLELLAVAGGNAAEPEEAAPRRGLLGRLFGGPVAAARRQGEADIGRLGLATTRHAEQRYNATSRVPDMVGPTVMEGERHGRTVEITLEPGRDRTRVGGAVPDFHVRSEDGRLLASERSPRGVHQALASLSPDRRWEGVEVKGGPDGVTVFHRRKGSHAGTQGYLDDLWLAEGLALAVGPAGASPAP